MTTASATRTSDFSIFNVRKDVNLARTARPAPALKIIGPFIREKIRRVLAKTRLIFSRINGPNVNFCFGVTSLLPFPLPSPLRKVRASGG